MVEIKMPKIGLSEADMTVVSWSKKVGDSIKKGEAIVVIQGEKLTNEIEAEQDGKLMEILIEEGTSVKINTVLAKMEV